MSADGTNASRAGLTVGSRRLLYSLEMAALGYSGIPQETRLLGKALIEHTSHKMSGLLMEARDQKTSHIRGRASKNEGDDVLPAANYLLGLSGFEAPGGKSRQRRIHRQLWQLWRAYARAAGGYPLYAIPPGLFEDTVWRRLFSATLPPEDKPLIDQLRLFYSQMTIADLHRARAAPFAPRPKLDTSAFEAVVFHDARPVRVNPKTAKFIRYHDAIPVSEPDLMGDGNYTSVHYSFVKMCRDDSWFVCNSDATRRSLVKIFPSLEKTSVVIPNVVNPVVDLMSERLDAWEIMTRRMSVPEGGKAPKIEIGAGHRSAGYVLAVSTLEPKKNVTGLVAAWERLQEMMVDPPRLVIVGAKGWNFEADLRALRPHLLSGRAFHLESVPQPELQALYRKARACCFPSFAEGFGYPPVEALVAGTVSVVSDLPALRETMGETAVYVDPYSPDSIAKGLYSIIEPENGEARRRALLAHSARQISLYSPARVAGFWGELIATTPPRGAGGPVTHNLEAALAGA